jgi:hypothetical protein
MTFKLERTTLELLAAKQCAGVYVRVDGISDARTARRAKSSKSYLPQIFHHVIIVSYRNGRSRIGQ